MFYLSPSRSIIDLSRSIINELRSVFSKCKPWNDVTKVKRKLSLKQYLNIDHTIYYYTVKPCIGKIHQMSYSSISDNEMLQIFSFFLIKWSCGAL